MAIIAKKTESDFTPAPEGLHQGVCVDVVDRGMQKTKFGVKHLVRFFWQIEERNIDKDERFVVFKDYTCTLGDKANLRKDLESWRGRKFTPNELDGFDLESCLGANCQVQVVHNTSSEGNVFANIHAIVPISKGASKMEPENYTREVDRLAEGSNGHADNARHPDDPGPSPGPFEATYDDVPF